MSVDEHASTAKILKAQDALLSSKKAREIRRYRSSRGLIVTSSGTSGINRPMPFIVPVSETDSPARSRNERPTELKRRNGADLPYESAIVALRAYHGLHGDLVIPRRYIVPATDPYPEEWHGVDLASSVYTMRWWLKNVKQKPARVAELNELGMIWGRLQPEWNLVLEALITFKTLEGDLLVPNKFVVPHGDERWPVATWGLALGSCVYRIRARNDFLRGSKALSRRDQLDRLGFVWDVHEYSFQKFYAALRHFARLELVGPFSSGSQIKAVRVPTAFVVPQSEAWPSSLWGYQLGAKCTAVRQKELYIKGKKRRQQLLEELGFRQSGNADLGWLKVVHAAAIFSRLNERQLDVPYQFVVPKPPDKKAVEDWPWPEHLWGLRLGQRLKDVRVRGAYVSGPAGKARRRQLDALGFNWTPKRGRRKTS